MEPMWMLGTMMELKLTAPSGDLYVMPLPLVVPMGQISDGEIVRFTWDRTDPETGETHHGAARLVVQDLPDPRTAAEEQPPAAEATALRYTDNAHPVTRPSGGLPLLPPYMPPRP